MSKSPLISVILPVYNCELYIKEAIDSILNQTFVDFEFLIIDDASTDETIKIIKQFADPRIKLILKEANQGVSSAVNDGLRLAKGKYIARMDGDDISIKERFEKQIKILESDPEIFICGSLVQYMGGSNSIILYKETHNEIISELLISCSVCMGSSMFRRNELAAYFYDEDKNSGEDYDFWTKIAWLGKMYNIQEVLLLYRVHPEQASIAHKQHQILDDIQIRLHLFKKIKYDTIKYPDDLISKILLLNQAITIKEFNLFLDWLKELLFLNNKLEVYPQNEFSNVLNKIKRSILFSLYLKKTSIGITKKWRTKVLFSLSMNDFLFILKLKGREIRKRMLKK